jgi:predicted DNA binding CopG/RHH family protein
MSKKIPEMTSDEAAESLLEQDMTEYLDLKNWQKVSFEFQPKVKTVNMRFSQPLYEAVKQAAEKEGISYQRYIRQAVENSLRTQHLEQRP